MSPTPASRPRCTASNLEKRGELSLTVLATDHHPRGTIRRSRSGRRRAIVLATVQLLIIAHVVVWLLARKYGWWEGLTTTPIEPSESMEFVKHGVINAGLIFFALALGSTVILGRWFCGWGCHVVMLQDLCGWIMRKMGVRPKPFRSRLLIYVPLVLALYMFVWPAFYRLAVAPWIRPDLEWPGFSLHLTTTEFWKTFPGVAVAVPFLLVCGFAAVYFLGSKGFCTYGCPYGGFFAPVDEFAVGRIRVTDACQHCGHCTAVCTSNVRVHEEVREYGMVVDPGCMKCLDCVSVCPENALYFGFGRPAKLKGPPRHKAPKRTYDLSWGLEFALVAVFAAVFFSVRGVYNVIPMLMAAGIAGVVTFVAWKLWSLVSAPNVRLHQFQFKLKGRMQRGGWIFAGLASGALAVTAHSGIVNGLEAAGGWYDRRVAIPVEQVLTATPAPLPAPMDRAAARAIRLYGFAQGFGDGGIGLTGNADIDVRLAWLHCCRGDFAEAERLLRRALERQGPSQVLARDLARVLRVQGKEREALDLCRLTLTRHLEYTHLLGETVQWCVQQGLAAEATSICRARLEIDPDDLPTLRWLSYLLADRGRWDESLALVRRAIELDPENPTTYRTLAQVLAGQGDRPGARQAMDRARELEDAGCSGEHP